MKRGRYKPRVSPEIRKKIMKYGCADCGNYIQKTTGCKYNFNCPYAKEFGDHETYQDYLEAQPAPSYDIFDRGRKEFM